MQDLPYLRFVADFASPALIAAYDELPLWSAMFGLLLLDEVPLAGIQTVLDVGCGTGFPLIELAERLGPSAVVHGVDPWKGGLARSTEKIASRATPNVTLHEGTAAQLPFPDAAFDLIVSNLGINNFDDPPAVLRECHRVLRNGGVLALTTNLQGHMHEFYAVFEEVLRAHGQPGQLSALHNHVAHRATVPGVRELLERAGFAVVRVVERAATMRFANGTALLNHHFIKLGFLDAWKSIVAGHEQEIFRKLEESLNRTADEKRELVLTIPMAYLEAKPSTATASRLAEE